MPASTHHEEEGDGVASYPGNRRERHNLKDKELLTSEICVQNLAQLAVTRSQKPIQPSNLIHDLPPSSSGTGPLDLSNQDGT
jgi:hypothetical protein